MGAWILPPAIHRAFGGLPEGDGFVHCRGRAVSLGAYRRCARRFFLKNCAPVARFWATFLILRAMVKGHGQKPTFIIYSIRGAKRRKAPCGTLRENELRRIARCTKYFANPTTIQQMRARLPRACLRGGRGGGSLPRPGKSQRRRSMCGPGGRRRETGPRQARIAPAQAEYLILPAILQVRYRWFLSLDLWGWGW